MAFSCVLVVAVACIVAYGLYKSLVLGDFSDMEEDALVEDTQVVLLVIASLTFVRYLFHGEVKFRAIFAFFAFLYYSFIMREVDFEKFGLDERITFCFEGVGRNIIAVVMFTAIFLWVIFTDLKGYWKQTLKITFSKWGAAMVVSLILVAVAQIFEKTLSGDMANLCEEVPEVIGYLGFTLCAIDPLGWLKQHFVFKK